MSGTRVPMTASEAKSRLDAKKKYETDLTLNTIALAVEKAIEKGDAKISINSCSDEVEKELNKLGYTVSHRQSGNNEYEYVIDFSSPKAPIRTMKQQDDKTTEDY